MHAFRAEVQKFALNGGFPLKREALFFLRGEGWGGERGLGIGETPSPRLQSLCRLLLLENHALD